MQNLYFAYQQEPTSNRFPDNQKLLEYQSMIQGIRDQLSPRSWRKIDFEIIEIFLNDLNEIINEIDNYNIDSFITGLNRICKLLNGAITQLVVAQDVLEENKKGEFNRQIKTQYYECLQQCREYLDEVSQEVVILK